MLSRRQSVSKNCFLERESGEELPGVAAEAAVALATQQATRCPGHCVQEVEATSSTVLPA